MSKTTERIEELQKLTAELDTQSRKAANSIKRTHAAALRAAIKLRDDLAECVSDDVRRKRYCRIIEDTVKNKIQTELDTATLILNQFINAYVLTRDNANGMQATDGRYILRHLARLNNLANDRRFKVLQAVVLAAQGKIDSGLIEFNKDWAQDLNVNDAEHLAKIADPVAAAKYNKSLEEPAEAFAKVQSYVDTLVQAEPRLYTIGEPSVTKVSVRNTKIGDIGFGGVKFKGRAVTDLEPDEFNRIRDHRFFKAHLESGALQLITEGHHINPL
jgi:hypothetical protein